MTGVRALRSATALLVLVVIGQQVVTEGPLTRLDRTVEDWLVPRRDNLVTEVARLVTWLGGPGLVVSLLALLAVGIGMRQRSLRVPLRVGAVLVALALSVLVLKDVIARPAAHGGTTHGGAWPSGHTATATVVWGCVVRLLRPDRRLARLLDVGIPAAVAGCLVVAGYHQVSDVLAGFALGTVLLELAVPRDAVRPVDARAGPARDRAGSAPVGRALPGPGPRQGSPPGQPGGPGKPAGAAPDRGPPEGVRAPL